MAVARDEGHQRADALAGAGGAEAFQRLANREQKHDRRRFERLADQQRADGGNRHEQVDAEIVVDAQVVDAAACHRIEGDQRGDDVKCGGNCIVDERRQHAEQDDRAADDGETGFVFC